jgi:hypothetical protein
VFPVDWVVVSIDSVRPGKCGTGRPTSQTFAPVAAPTGCSAHRHCSPSSFCDTSGLCPSCATCTVNASFNDICPGKCDDALAAVGAPTAASLPPTAEPTPPPTQAPVVPPSDLCNSHNGARGCAPDYYCATPTLGAGNVCEPCSECAVSGNSFNGNCPDKCGATAAPVTAPPTIERVCIAHRECNASSYCTDGRQCEPCEDCIDGSTWNGHACPDKCAVVLGPQGQKVGSDSKDASANTSSAALAVGLTLVAVVVVGVAVFVATARKQRTDARGVVMTASLATAAANPRFDSVAGVDACIQPADLSWDVGSLTVDNTRAAPALVRTTRIACTSETTL